MCSSYLCLVSSNNRLVPASTPYPCLDSVRFPKSTLGVTIASSVIRSLAITPTPSKTNLPTRCQLPGFHRSTWVSNQGLLPIPASYRRNFGHFLAVYSDLAQNVLWLGLPPFLGPVRRCRAGQRNAFFEGCAEWRVKNCFCRRPRLGKDIHPRMRGPRISITCLLYQLPTIPYKPHPGVADCWVDSDQSPLLSSDRSIVTFASFSTMLVSFALAAIARALGETPEQGRPKPTVAITSTPRLTRTIQRFESLCRDWAECLRVQYYNVEDPELDKLFARTARVMSGSSIIFSDIKMKTRRGGVEISSGALVKILRSTRKAIVSSQRITHTKELQTWVLPTKPPPGTPSSDPAFQEYQRRKRINDKARLLVERRKRPVQCCMFIALALFQFLYPDEVHDFVAEYEDEIVHETFDRTLSVDDAKTYERLQLKHHCRARLTPPQGKMPRRVVPYGELACIPRFVRNPMACGAPIVTNQYRVKSNAPLLRMLHGMTDARILQKLRGSTSI
ncbi:hypothetical protein BKA56DRAFT_591975 [Ilyonectria sp. MPI-CAGE-AT-0026]|nr:hypothetical protein BKA56DRAFT_591975 [Ilyonectria sp. MPI-CAGE-AT-0026]